MVGLPVLPAGGVRNARLRPIGELSPDGVEDGLRACLAVGRLAGKVDDELVPVLGVTVPLGPGDRLRLIVDDVQRRRRGAQVPALPPSSRAHGIDRLFRRFTVAGSFLNWQSKTTSVSVSETEIDAFPSISTSSTLAVSFASPPTLLRTFNVTFSLRSAEPLAPCRG